MRRFRAFEKPLDKIAYLKKGNLLMFKNKKCTDRLFENFKL